MPKFAVAEEDSQSLQPISLQVNWNHQFQFAGYYAALKQGYYKEAGLDVTIEGWHPGINVVEEVVSGRADFAVGYGTLVVDYAKGEPISLVMASFQFSPMVLLSHFPITDLSELSGKRIMHYGNLQINGLVDKAKSLVSTPIEILKSSGDLNDFITHKVDLYAAYFTNEPYRLEQLNIPYYILDPKTYGVQSYGDFLITSQSKAQLQPAVVEKFKQATIKGWKYALDHQAEVVDYIMANYPVLKSREALLAEAKATTRYVKSGDTPIGKVETAKLLATAVGAKEAGLITQEQFDNIDINHFLFDPNRATLTSEEIEYLSHHPVIKLANDTHWEPFEFIDDQGVNRGIAAEYLKLFEKKFGLKFEPVTDKSWSEVVDMAQRGELDMYACAVPTEDRQAYMNFTKPFLSFPMVLAAKNGMTFIDEYSQLNGLSVAVVKGYWSQEYLQKNYPKIHVLLVDSVKEGLDAVMDGRVIAYTGNLAAINYAIRKYGFEGMRIVGQFDQRFELAMGVRKDNPLLFSIIQKALDSVTEQERRAIFDHWIKLEVVKKMDSRQMMEIGIPLLVVFVILISLVLFYAYQKRRQKEYIHQIHELSFATEIDIKTKKIIYSSDSFAKLSGYSREELVGMSYLNLARDSMSDEAKNRIFQLLLKGKEWKGEMQGRTRLGGAYWVDLTLTPIKDIFGNVKRVMATRINITDKKRIEQLSIVDDLTGLYNRRYFNQILERELTRARREKMPLSLVMFDIDYFKSINDAFGHQRGDEVLKEVTSVIKDSFSRGDDFVFRVGGEEFMAVAYLESYSLLQTHLQKICDEVAALSIENPASPYRVVTISIGAIFIESQELTDSSTVLNKVDKLLYEAKSQGRNRVVVEQKD
ncbi:diguanylate cyclase [Thiomicrorhabdus sp.]|uniref:diguanylate cyclase n=1 Tax=Thiomicrorhabdus sp. TaxID=2039724 RepID=UPI003566A357